MFLIDRSYREIKISNKKGRGVFAKKLITAGNVIGDYVGKLIRLEEMDFEKEKENLYLMNYRDEIGIYPDLTKDGVHLLNHSCSPNCFIYKYKMHTLVFALRDIEKREELTISYLLPPKKYCHPCPHKCFCKSEVCTGSMHLSEKDYKIWQKFQEINFKITEGSILSFKDRLKPLAKYPKSIPESYITKLDDLKLYVVKPSLP